MADNITRDKLPSLYQEIFEKNPAGVVVLDDLWSRFNDKPARYPLDALDLAFQEGQRSVIRFVQLQRDRLEREAQAVEENGE